MGALSPLPSAPAPIAQVVRPATPNPDIVEACGVDVTLILDASGSIQSAGAVDAVRDAGEAFLEGLADTGSTARVIDFGTNARETAARAIVTTFTLGPDGVFGQAIAAYYNPIPPFPAGVTGHAYRGGGRNVNDPSSFTTGSSVQYTNWDDALSRTGTAIPQLVVFVTDGAPNGVVDDHPGDPFYRAGDTSPDVRYALEGNNQANDLSLDRAVEEANRIKTGGARMLAVGVGDAFGSSGNVDRLKAVTNGPGSVIATSAGDITSLNDIDIALVSDFDALADALREVVTQLCSPSLTIRKLAQSAESAAYEPVAGWTMTVTPTVTAPGTPPYRWILPVANAPVGPQTTTTSAAGFAQFQWEPNPPTSNSTATVTETNQTGYTPRDWACNARNPDGTIVSTSGTFAPGVTTFTVAVGSEQIVTCTVRNDFNYAPSGVVTKVNSPKIVRGDGNGTSVTSTYTATNTGNTPLVPIAGTDTECAPVEYVMNGDVIAGDDGDEQLDPGETWTLQCTRQIQHATTDEDVVIDNTVTLTGRAPNGAVQSDDATDDIQVLTPDITLVKTVAPTAGIAPLDVTYTYEVSTNGNTPIADVTLDDDTAPCSDSANMTFVGGDTANAGYLDPGETWTYTCDADDLSTGVVNTATVSGQPVTPADPQVTGPALDPIGARVEATDDAEVVVDTADLLFVKTASPLAGFPGTAITYTFDVTNPASATAVLVPQDGRDGVVVDGQCAPVTFVSGDTNDDSRLEPGETWVYTCTRNYTSPGPKPNTATATLETETTGDVLARSDPALVLIVAPAIHLEKRTDSGTVYDGDTVTYLYAASNPTSVPLQNVVVTDDAGPGTCAPVTFVTGDDDVDNLLDLGELWEYTCTTTVTKTGSPDAPQEILNTATVVGTPVLGSLTGAPVTDDDDAVVTVIDPSITLVKSVAPTEVRLPGGNVTWTVEVTNTGDSQLFEAVVSDDTCSPMEYQAGDTGGDGIMDPDETWTFTCSGLVTTNTTNTADVIAADILGGEVDSVDTAEVTTFSSSIDLVKVVSDELVPEGDTVAYTYTATNTGTDALTNVVLEDDTCSPLSAPTGDTGGDGVMDPGEAWTYTCSQAIGAPTTNIAVVTGQDHTGAVVTADDAQTVIPFRTGINVTKTATPTVLYGPGEVTYRYEVTNTGNVPLADVKSRISDDTCPDVEYVSGDDDLNELLTGVDDIFETGPPETWIFTCTTTVTEDTVNTVVVTGTPTGGDAQGEPLAPDVDNDADATVEVLPPGSITIVKDISDTGADDDAFDFTGDLGPFTLTTVNGTDDRLFADLQPGVYDVTEVASQQWALAAIQCEDPTENSVRSGAKIQIHLDGSESITCTFINVTVAPTDTIQAVSFAVEDVATTVNRALALPARGPVGYGLLLLAPATAAAALALMLFHLWRRRRHPATITAPTEDRPD